MPSERSLGFVGRQEEIRRQPLTGWTEARIRAARPIVQA